MTSEAVLRKELQELARETVPFDGWVVPVIFDVIWPRISAVLSALKEEIEAGHEREFLILSMLEDDFRQALKAAKP